MFDGTAEKDVRKSIHVGPVPMPALAPDEVLVAVMASGITYNTVWSAVFEPVPTFAFLAEYGKQGRWEARHDLPYHVIGSDAAGVVVRTGAGVRRWRTGDAVVVATGVVDAEDPAVHADSMEVNRLISLGHIRPALSAVHALRRALDGHGVVVLRGVRPGPGGLETVARLVGSPRPVPSPHSFPPSPGQPVRAGHHHRHPPLGPP